MQTWTSEAAQQADVESAAALGAVGVIGARASGIHSARLAPRRLPDYTTHTHTYPTANGYNTTTTMPSLAATYASPASAPQTFSSTLPALSTPVSTTARVAYLASLQTSLRALQADINTLLTQKMADDKAAGDAQDEETYGEEVVDQD